MTDLSTQQLASVAVHATAAVVWGGVALSAWRQARAMPTRGALFRLLRVMTTSTALFYTGEMALHLVPVGVAAFPPVWLRLLWLVTEGSLLLTAASVRHTTRYWGMRFDAPSRSWLIVNYGSAALVLAVALAVVTTGAALGPYLLLRSLFVAGMLGLAVLSMAGVARRGAWRPGAAANVIRTADIALLAVGITVMVLAIALIARDSGPGAAWTGVAIDALIAASVTVPLAVRELRVALRSLAVAAGAIVLAAILFRAEHLLISPLAEDGAPKLAFVLQLLSISAAMAAAAALPRLVDRLFFRTKRHLWEDLQRFLATLDPQEGVAACCRRALAEIVQAADLRGAAIVLHDGEAITEGAFAVAPLVGVWPRGEALMALPGTIIGPDHVHMLSPEIIEALIESQVTGVVTIDSPRRRWGTLFGTSGLIEPQPDDAPAVKGFAAELALVLDTAALIEHTVSVERSLAHAEKLAAIGEVAARIAHEIRNPVTAAGSLAQLMSRDPTAPENVEYVALILSELERVERHVRGLLRFARREEYAQESVDVGALARDTLEPFAPRLEAADIAAHLDAAPDVLVTGDREKLRQVLVNLIENACDALAEVSDRRIALRVERSNGRALLSVTDTGPGIPSECIARVFEPFFSTKASGTGLGLAIVRRIIDAHGGQITAARDGGSGTVVRIDLPARA